MKHRFCNFRVVLEIDKQGIEMRMMLRMKTRKGPLFPRLRSRVRIMMLPSLFFGLLIDVFSWKWIIFPYS